MEVVLATLGSGVGGLETLEWYGVGFSYGSVGLSDIPGSDDWSDEVRR